MKAGKKAEPGMIIKPLGRYGGLDSLHLSLAVAVVLLFLLLLVVSYGKPILITSNSTSNCTNSSAGGSCPGPKHTAAQIGLLAEQVLASYGGINSSLSLLPFISNSSAMNVSYLPASKSWYVFLPAKNFVSNIGFTFAILISDLNTSEITPLLQTVKPSRISNNSVVSLGVVKLAGKAPCLARSPMNLYWFIDPYAFGAVKSLENASTIEQLYGSRANLTIKIIVGQDTQRVASSTSLFNALQLSRYTFCASKQKNFAGFVSDLNGYYSGAYVPQTDLNNSARAASLNFTQLNACLDSATQAINSQALLAQYYNITQTPEAVVDCQYLALPQTAKQALCYANSTLC